MAVFAFKIGGIWRVIGDEENDLIRTIRGRLEWVESGGGNDRIIARENRTGLQPDDNPFTKPNPHFYIPDTVDAGEGNDAIIIEARAGTYYGNDGNDTISNAGPAIDGFVTELYGDDASMTNTSGHGNDTIGAGDGDEYIDGGGGRDELTYLLANAGVTVILGDENADGSTSEGSASGGSGNDEIYRIEDLVGSHYDDSLRGSNVDNVMSGGNGNDTILGRDGEDIIFGNNGNDVLWGGNQDDELHGGAGDDGLVGGQGNDLFVPGSGNNALSGFIGFDTVDYRGSAGPLFVNLAQGFTHRELPSGVLEIDTISGVENVDASRFGDFIFGNGLANTLRGFRGDDVIAGLNNNDVVFGGRGNDLLSGNQGIDVLWGGRHNDSLFGGLGNDFVYGNEGNDALAGGPGSDFMDGEEGDDRYVWGPEDFGGGAFDTVLSFVPFSDTLVFSGIVDDPETALASDYLSARVEGNDTILTFDFDGTSGSGTGANFSEFAEIRGIQVDTAQQLAALQLAGAIEFI